MLRNYLKIAFRNIKKHKIYSLINILGLAVGMAVCLLIYLWVHNELSFDKYHEKAGQIYRVGPVVEASKIKLSWSPPPLAAALKNDFPEVLQATRLISSSYSSLVGYKHKKFLENKRLYADSTIFDVFTIPFLKGNSKTALSNPKSVVLTEKIAKKYFGDKNPVGESIYIQNPESLFKVTGVVNNCPINSNLQYDYITTADFDEWGGWGSHCLFTYIVLPPDYSPARLESKFPDFIKRNLGEYIQLEYGKSIEEFFRNQNNLYEFWLQPIKDIHLNANINDNLPNKGNMNYVYIFSIIAIFILIIACINFINLSTAKSVNRANEIGLRKMIGSSKASIIRQFLTESILLSFISMLFAIFIIEISKPYYNNLIDKKLTIRYFENPLILLGLIGVVLLVGIVAGIYPAFYLSSFQPADIFNGGNRIGLKGKNLRSGLVIFQFTISIIILLGIFMVFKQTKFVQDIKLGFNQNQILVLHRANTALGNDLDAFIQDLAMYPDILCVSNTSSLPGRHFDPNGHRLENKPLSEEYTLFTMYADHNYAKLLDLKIVKGRYFLPDISSDKTQAVVINEAAVNELGLTDPLGKRFLKEYDNAKKGEYVTIIGVLKDFHFHSLHHQIQPMIIRNLGNNSGGFYLSLKIQSDDLKGTIGKIEKKWKAATGDQPFEYSFLDEDFNKLYQKEIKLSKILGVFFILSILITGLGLFGLASFMVERRRKEIGIRKVLGSSNYGIFNNLISNFIKLVLISNIIAWPFAYYFMNKWLQGFAYRTNMGIGVFLLAAVVSFAIALFAVSFQTIKATSINPIDNLKYE